MSRYSPLFTSCSNGVRGRCLPFEGMPTLANSLTLIEILMMKFAAGYVYSQQATLAPPRWSIALDISFITLCLTSMVTLECTSAMFLRISVPFLKANCSSFLVASSPRSMKIVVA